MPIEQTFLKLAAAIPATSVYGRWYPANYNDQPCQIKSTSGKGPIRFLHVRTAASHFRVNLEDGTIRTRGLSLGVNR